MNKKPNDKQYQSSIALYEKLKMVLKAEKNNVVMGDQFNKGKKKQTLNQGVISQAFNLNDILINSESSKIGFGLVNSVEKSSMPNQMPMTPYLQRKQIQKGINLKSTDGKKKKVPYFQVFKGKNRHILAVKESRQKRLNNFFSSKQNKQQNLQQKQQNQQNLTYSLILKTLNQQGQGQKPSITQKIINKTQNISVKYQRFFNNFQIQKNIQSIKTIKKQISQSHQKNSKMVKHFPQLQILNQNYFTQSKKNLFKRINSNSVFGSLCGHKELIITSKNVDIKDHQCKKFIIEKENLAEKERKFLEQQKRKNFQYFVYQYKTVGDRESKISQHSLSPSNKYKPYRQRSAIQSATFLRSKPSFFHKPQPQSTKSVDLSSNNMFHNFIYKNKQAVSAQSNLKSSQTRQRSMTANVKAREINYSKFGLGRVNGDGWKSVGLKREVKNGVDDNFVKPWESSAQGEVGF